jgi:hypothetical protein
MGLVTRFVRGRDPSPNYRTKVVCGWNFEERDGQVLLRLETYGSSGRAVPGKRSQSLEIDRHRAEELVRIINTAFPGISTGN